MIYPLQNLITNIIFHYTTFDAVQWGWIKETGLKLSGININNNPLLYCHPQYITPRLTPVIILMWINDCFFIPLLILKYHFYCSIQ